MAFFKKKPAEEAELPSLPEGDELPPLPPLPGEEELPPFPEPEESPKPARKMRPGAPLIPEVSMSASAAVWQSASVEKPAATVFVKLDKYKDIMRTVSEIDNKLAELKATLDRISAIKTREGEIIDGWAAMLNEAKSKIDEVTSKLTKPEA
jgi:hypothetical protein